MSEGFETKKRSFVKTITWRLVATAVTLTVAYIFTGKFGLSVEITGAAAIFSTLFYFIHERVWNRVKWGRK